MAHTRRDFLKASAAAAGAMAIGLQGCGGGEEGGRSSAPAPLRILILGGTGFIGPHMVRRARARGHTVTLFNRGRTNADMFPDVEKLIGDRDGQLDALRGHEWDAVIDNSGYFPRHVRDSAQLLSSSAQQYLFISSVSAYGNFESPGIDEDYVLGTMDDPTVEEMTGETYGPLKVLCEQAVQEIYPAGATIVRPGYIVGPGDSTDRWTYWPVRVAAGGEMLAPGNPDAPIQVIDARDLASFVVHTLEERTLGVYNAVGPATPMGMGAMLDTMKATTGADTTFTWVSEEFVAAQEAVFPIWAPSTGPFANVHRVKNARAVGAGMTYRPVAETVADTLQWWNTLAEERREGMRSGLRTAELGFQPASLATQREAEAKLLEAWRAQSE